LNRFALGQLKNRIMTSTGIPASATDPFDWVRVLRGGLFAAIWASWLATSAP
jgi:hypothetical protein